MYYILQYFVLFNLYIDGKSNNGYRKFDGNTRGGTVKTEVKVSIGYKCITLLHSQGISDCLSCIIYNK